MNRTGRDLQSENPTTSDGRRSMAWRQCVRCHAFSRFERVKAQVELTLPKRGGIPRELRREDFSGRGAIFLGSEARFDYLVALPEDRDLARAIVHAMESIEDDYETLKGVLPMSRTNKLSRSREAPAR